jgi:hypothetical protein
MITHGFASGRKGAGLKRLNIEAVEGTGGRRIFTSAGVSLVGVCIL